MATKHASQYVERPTADGWAATLGRGIDAAITELAGDHEIVSVAVLPITGSDLAYDVVYPVLRGAIVTVVWRESS